MTMGAAEKVDICDYVEGRFRRCVVDMSGLRGVSCRAVG